MANEAVLWIQKSPPIPYTVADATGIEKGTHLKLGDPRTASQTSGTDDLVAGFAATEKIASNGQTKLGVYVDGWFKVIASGTVTVGDPLGFAGIDGQNYVYSNRLVANNSGLRTVGTAEESAVDEETFIMQLNPTVIAQFVAT